MEEFLRITNTFLKKLDHNLLVVFDNVEDLLYYDKKGFRIFINEILTTCPHFHILLTSRTTLGAL